ncbi:prohibitin family protein [Bradyrhizobium sp. HKCCYLRH3099]|uniref:prohibitin family protein n=1 Tax=unclassified Bradyrhizobium TaxID=2631580 RepID=UPI003EB8FC8D
MSVAYPDRSSRNSPSPLRPTRGRLRDRIEAYVVGTIALAGILVLLLWRLVIVVVPAGHVGVLYSLLGGGTVIDDVFREGLALKLPWNKMYLFETRVQSLPLDVEALSLEGLRVDVKANLIFHIDGNAAPRLLKEVGTDYVNRLIMPVTQGVVRRVIGKFDSHRLYTIDSELLTGQMLEALRGEPKSSILIYDDMVVTRVILPDGMRKAIEDKLTQEQYAASYEFILARARSEAERQRIEAIGLENYYATVARALSKDVLTWTGIQATLDLARSNNSKVVVVGGGTNQMPLILGSEVSSGSATAPNPGIMGLDSTKLTFPKVENPARDPLENPIGPGLPGRARMTPLGVPPAPTRQGSPIPAAPVQNAQ